MEKLDKALFLGRKDYRVIDDTPDSDFSKHL